MGAYQGMEVHLRSILTSALEMRRQCHEKTNPLHQEKDPPRVELTAVFTAARYSFIF